MIIDGISTSEHLDSSGEILKVDGHDISDLVESKGVLNWEHNNDSPEDILGHIVFAKKIYGPHDCDDERQKMYWKTCAKPFVYIKAELMDDEMHPGAVAAAAMIRYYAKRNEKLLCGFSIEGNTLKRNDNVLERSVGRRVALTLRPCNRSCIAGLLEDPAMKYVVQKAEGFAPNTDLYEVDTPIFDDVVPTTVEEALADLKKSVQDLYKTLTAGGGNAAPSQLVGGAALSREHFINDTDKNRMKAAFRDWPRSRPLVEWLKAELPDVSEKYIDHFANIAQHVSLRKGIKPPLRISALHGTGPATQTSSQQHGLVEGLYHDQAKDYSPSHGYHGGAGGIMDLKNDAGQRVLVKLDNGGSAHAATAYHNLARDFFGLGKHVPTTHMYAHPELNGGEHHLAMEYVKGGKVPGVRHKEWQSAQEDGTADKLALMDLITGTSDRHEFNVLAHPEHGIVHVDNDSAFSYVPDSAVSSSYVGHSGDGMGGRTLHPEAIAWVNQLDPKKLAFLMKRNGLQHHQISEALRRLEVLRSPEIADKSLWDIHEDISAPHVHDLEEDE